MGLEKNLIFSPKPEYLHSGRYTMLNDERIKEQASARHKLHEQQLSHRPLASVKTGDNKNYEYVGLAGEYGFAEEFGLQVDERLLPSGDKGKDFKHPDVGVIDIKTAQIPKNLLVEEGHVRADIFVLSGFDVEKKKRWYVGWAYKKEVLAKGPVAWPYHVVNHIVPADELRPMYKLKEMCGIWVDPFEKLGI